MLDGERFYHDRANTAGSGKSREGHQQVAEQREQQFHSERDFNSLSTVSKSALRLPVLPKSTIRHTQASVLNEAAGSGLQLASEAISAPTERQVEIRAELERIVRAIDKIKASYKH